MKFQAQEPPRVFRVGIKQDIEMHDCGRMYLHPDEQITFVTPSGKEHDFAAKSWGFYATPSINSRLKDQGFKTALVRNRSGRLYVMVVEKEKLNEFNEYLQAEENEVVEWLDERQG